MQIPLHTESTVEAYIAAREWRAVRMVTCPLHADGGCSFARHGSYSRATPQGMRIARWYCPQGHRTFSLLPDFLAAKLPGLLSSIEFAANAAKSAASMESAADALRDFEVTLPGAVRWLRRRVRAVQAAVDAVSQTAGDTVLHRLARLQASRIDAERGVLLELRCTLPPRLLQRLPAPLGFLAGATGSLCDSDQQHMGPDGDHGVRYGAATSVRHRPCNASPPQRHPRSRSRRSATCVASGVPTAA